MTLEAVTPGEYKARGRGITLRHGHGRHALRAGADRAFGRAASRSSPSPTPTAASTAGTHFRAAWREATLGARRRRGAAALPATIWRLGARDATVGSRCGCTAAISSCRSGGRCSPRAGDSTVSYARLAQDIGRRSRVPCRGQRRGRESRGVADPVPPRAARQWRARRLPVGRRAQAGDARVGSRAVAQERFSSSSFGFSRFGRIALSIDSCILASVSRFCAGQVRHRRERRVRDDLGDLRLQRCPAGAGTSRRSSRGSSRGSPASSCRRSG